MWLKGSQCIARINDQVLEDIEDFIILRSFTDAKLTNPLIQKLIDENLEVQRNRARMYQAEEEAKQVPDETVKDQKPVDIIEEGKVEDGKRKFMTPLRPHEMIWNFIYDEETKRPKHVLRPEAAPQKCYIDGRVEELLGLIEQVGEIIKSFTPERWDKLRDHTVEIFVA